MADDQLDRELPFGERSDGRLVGVAEVERGEACDCVCPDCRRPLIAHKGIERAHHFQHKPAPGLPSTCAGYYETALHKLAKQVLGDAEQLYLPPQVARYLHHRDTLVPAAWVSIGNVRTEVRLGSIVPDIMAEAEGQDLVVEIYVTHRSTDEKVAFLRDSQIAAIEIDLSGAQRMAADLVAPFILGGAPRHWLWAPGLDEATEALRVRVEARLARQRAQAEAEAAAREQERERQRALIERQAREHQADMDRRHAEYQAQWERGREERAAADEHRQAMLAELPVWAANYYPTRATAPPVGLAATHLTTGELVALFGQTTSESAHLALVDQTPIRRAIEQSRDPAVREAVAASWRRHQPGRNQ